MRRILSRSASSVAVGVFIGTVMSLIFSYLDGAKYFSPSNSIFTSQFIRPLDAVLISVILWGLMGLVFGLGYYIFEIKDWSLTKQTIVNFIVYYAGFTPLALFAGWFPLTWPSFAAFTMAFIVVYAIIWLIAYYIDKRDNDKAFE